MFIYVIVCSETLKIYVGQHKGPNLSWYLTRKWWDANHHTSGTRSHLYNAMRQHPRESWSIHPLVSNVTTRAELDALEQHYIHVLNTQHSDVGYNICRGGEGFTGPHTEKWRQETLAGVRAYWEKPEGHQRISNHMKERWKNPEFRQMMTERAAKRRYPGRILSEETKTKIGLAHKGQQHTLGRILTEEHKRKIGLASTRVQTGVPKSAEHKAKLIPILAAAREARRLKLQQQDFSIHK